MKTAALAVCMVLCHLTARGNLGETAIQLDARFGKPMIVDLTRMYSINGLIVIATLEDGRCVHEMQSRQDKVNPLSKKEALVIRDAHAPAGQWELINNDNGGECWDSRDGRFRAAWFDGIFTIMKRSEVGK